MGDVEIPRLGTKNRVLLVMTDPILFSRMSYAAHEVESGS